MSQYKTIRSNQDKPKTDSSDNNVLIKLHPTPPPFSDATLNMLRYIASPDELLAFLSTVRAMRAGYSVGSWESELVIDIITRLSARAGETLPDVREVADQAIG